MATQKVVVAGSSGVTASQLKDFFRQIEDGSLTGVHLQAILEHRNPFGSDWHTVTVDYSKSLVEMIAAGRHDWANCDFTAERFPLKGAGVVERSVSLCHYNRTMTSEDAITAMVAAGQEPATIEDLLAFGARYPEELRKYPIIALGSSAKVHGKRSVACFRRDGSRPTLRLNVFDYDWFASCRFLARNKISGISV